MIFRRNSQKEKTVSIEAMDEAEQVKYLSDNNKNNPAALLCTQDQKKRIRKLIQKLKPALRKVIILKYGLNDKPFSQFQISKMLKISQQQISKMENQAGLRTRRRHHRPPLRQTKAHGNERRRRKPS